MKTFRRDRLLRLAKAGKLICVDSYSFCDMHGESRSSNETPVRVKADYNDHVYGYINLDEGDFSSSSGGAYYETETRIRLRIHSNLGFTFRIVS